MTIYNSRKRIVMEITLETTKTYVKTIKRTNRIQMRLIRKTLKINGNKIPTNRRSTAKKRVQII